jgi:hypothetical protein
VLLILTTIRRVVNLADEVPIPRPEQSGEMGNRNNRRNHSRAPYGRVNSVWSDHCTELILIRVLAL